MPVYIAALQLLNYSAAADKINMIRSLIFTTEYMIGANRNMKSAAHFFI